MPRKTTFRQPIWVLAALGAAGMLAFGPSNSWAASDLDRWRAHMEPADQAHLSGNLQGAEEHYLQALKVAERLDTSGEYLERTMASLGGLYFSEGRYDTAVPFYREALSIAEALYDSGHARHAVIAVYRRTLDQAEAAGRRLAALRKQTRDVLEEKTPGPQPTASVPENAGGAAATVQPAVYVPVTYPPGIPLRGMPVPIQISKAEVAPAPPPPPPPRTDDIADLSSYTLASAPVPAKEEAAASQLEVRTDMFFPQGVPQRGMPLPKLTIPSSPLPPEEAVKVDAASFPEGVPQRGMPLPDLQVASSPLPVEDQVASARVSDKPVASRMPADIQAPEPASVADRAPSADQPTPVAQSPVPAKVDNVKPEAVAATKTDGGSTGTQIATSAGSSEPAEETLPPYDGSGPLVIRISPRRGADETKADTAPPAVDRGSWEAAKVEVAGRRVDAETKALEADPVAPPEVAQRATAAETAKQIAARRALIERHPVLGIRLPGAKRNTGPIFPETPRLADTEEAYKAQLEHLEKSVGKEHPDVAEVIYKLARLYHRQSRYELAGEMYERCLVMREEVLPPGHPDTIQTYKKYIRLMRASGLTDLAQELRERMKEYQAKAQSADAN